jgi:hypothetical protein
VPNALTKDDILGSKRSITEIAHACGYKHPRPIRELIRQLGVPYVLINRIPHVDPQAIRDALERRQVSAAPRGRGRPKKGS